MIDRDDLPDTPDWHPEPHPCAVFGLADYARRRVIATNGDDVPVNVELGEN